jgi:hypothetical protein
VLEEIGRILCPKSVLFSKLVSLERRKTPKPGKPKGAMGVLRFLLKRNALAEKLRKAQKDERAS